MDPMEQTVERVELVERSNGGAYELKIRELVILSSLTVPCSGGTHLLVYPLGRSARGYTQVVRKGGSGARRRGLLGPGSCPFYLS